MNYKGFRGKFMFWEYKEYHNCVWKSEKKNGNKEITI